MQLNFQKVAFTESDITTSYDTINLIGSIKKLNRDLVKVEAVLNGNLNLECYRCGNEFQLDTNEDISFLVSNGIYKAEDNNNSLDDVIIEIDNGIIDFDDIIISEIESIKSDYHSCGKCNNIKEFQF